MKVEAERRPIQVCNKVVTALTN